MSNIDKTLLSGSMGTMLLKLLSLTIHHLNIMNAGQRSAFLFTLNPIRKKGLSQNVWVAWPNRYSIPLPGGYAKLS